MNIIELWKTACDDGNTSQYNLEKFAELVAAHEREECAKLFESIQQDNTSLGGIHFLLHDTAKAIRARSKA